MQDRVSRPDDAAPAGGCPICGKPRQARFAPFCSPRCADIDLGRWLSGGYAIAGGTAEADEDGDDARARAGSDAADATSGHEHVENRRHQRGKSDEDA